MQLSFTGATAFQEDLIHQTIKHLKQRHLKLDLFTHTWNLTFVQNPDTSPHDAFVTFATTDSSGDTIVDRDMPFRGQGSFAGAHFFMETIAHELGHSLLGNGPGEGHLGTDRQTEIAAMFDSTPSVWNPQNKPWFNRPVESIAETFKDAFFPAQFRTYFNRTHYKLGLRHYPAFRALWLPGEEIIS